MWSEFRANPDVMAFYEPLHELLKDIKREGIRRESPTEWNSHHPDGPPYFEEFTPLLARRGIARYHRSFAFDRFFLARHEREPRLQAYLSQLVDLAHSSGKLPVLKFCRSHGRVAWMRAHFPNALHVAVLRDPVAQWNSAWRQAESGNPYFLAAPLAILARHLSEPMVAQVRNTSRRASSTIAPEVVRANLRAMRALCPNLDRGGALPELFGVLAGERVQIPAARRCDDPRGCPRRIHDLSQEHPGRLAWHRPALPWILRMRAPRRPKGLPTDCARARSAAPMRTRCSPLRRRSTRSMERLMTLRT